MPVLGGLNKNDSPIVRLPASGLSGDFTLLKLCKSRAHSGKIPADRIFILQVL
jgi:hypothetical protein